MTTTEGPTPTREPTCIPTSAASVVQRLLREHRRWRSKDFPFISYLFDEARSVEGGDAPCLAPLRSAFHRLYAEMEGI